MTPTFAPSWPSTSHVSAGAAPRWAGSGVRSNSVSQRGQDLVGGDHLVPVPDVPGVERHLLDEAHLVAVVEGEPQQAHGLVVVDAAHAAPR